MTIEEGKEFLRRANQKTCLHPDAPNACRLPIVRAHTVPKRGTLARIAENGHVYTTLREFPSLLKNGQQVVPDLRGIGHASTITGFCAFHDTTLFKPLETEAFAATPEQVFLLAYRALAYEYYKKCVLLQTISKLRQHADRGRSLREQVSLQRWAATEERNIRTGLRDLTSIREEFDRFLVVRDFRSIEAYVVRIDRPPDVTCSTAIYPEYDFDGHKLQDLSDLDLKLDLVSFSSVATDDGRGALVFAWLRDQASGRRICESLHQVSSDELPSAILRFVFEFAENVFWRPSWWTGLPPATKDKLVNRMNTGLRSEHDAGCLRDDGLRPVDWVVEDRRWILDRLSGA